MSIDVASFQTQTIQLSYQQIERALQKVATLPVRPNSKVPAVTHGYKSGIVNAPITKWLANRYNIAISLPLSDLVCIDVDMHGQNGVEEYKKLVELFGAIDSYTEVTPTGRGLHIITKADGISEAAKNCDLANGVEFKKNALIVIAPSIINQTSYKILSGVNTDGSYVFASLNEKWCKFINEKAVKTPNYKLSPQTGGSEFKPDERALDYDRILSKCNFLRYLADNPDDISEPVWYSAINMLTSNTNTDDFIHKISEGYSNYTFAETQRKINESRSKGIHRGCNYIARHHYEYCKGCPKAKQIQRKYNND